MRNGFFCTLAGVTLNVALAGRTKAAWNMLFKAGLGPKPSVLPGLRIYAVGDVHGRADLLTKLLTRIDADLKSNPAADMLQVFLGDYIDRGPYSRQVLDLLIARRRATNVVLIRGNHESFMSDVLNNPMMLPDWRGVGGINTFLSYGVVPPDNHDPKSLQEAVTSFAQAIPDSHRGLLQSFALSFTCGDYFFTHAGVRPGIPLQTQAQHDLLWIRDDFLLHEEDFGKVIVHGHTPVQEPNVFPNRINIDTGAYATGRLTCLVLEGDKMRFL